LIRVLRHRLWYAPKYWLRQWRLTTRLGIGLVGLGIVAVLAYVFTDLLDA
jgi:hypothetical protein